MYVDIKYTAKIQELSNLLTFPAEKVWFFQFTIPDWVSESLIA